MSYYDNSKELDQIADLQATIADLQGQVKAAQKKVDEMNAWVLAMSTANLATMAHTSEMQERALEAEQRVAQLEGELKEQIHEREHYYQRWIQRTEEFESMQQERDTLQADHARVLGLVQDTVEFFKSNFENAGLELCGLMGGKEITYTGQRLNELIEQLAASLPAQPAQGGAKCVWVDDEGGIYQTGCKHAFMVDPDSDEPPIWIKFCCYCGSLVEFFVPAAEGETRA